MAHFRKDYTHSAHHDAQDIFGEHGANDRSFSKAFTPNRVASRSFLTSLLAKAMDALYLKAFNRNAHLDDLHEELGRLEREQRRIQDEMVAAWDRSSYSQMARFNLIMADLNVKHKYVKRCIMYLSD